MTLQSIYQPIQKEMPALNRALARELIHEEGLLSDIGHHLLDTAGKRLRPALVLLSGKALSKTPRGLVNLACAVEMIHVATLVHDDVIDQAKVRRRKATSNAQWGNTASVIMGDYLYARAFGLLTSLGSPRILEEISHTAVQLCQGEMLQTARAFDPTLREDEYFDIIAKKTASLMQAAASMGAVLGGAPRSLTTALSVYGQRLGMAFQIVDDCLDFTGTEEEFGKEVHADLKKGKLTLPMIHLLHTGGQARRQAEKILWQSRDGFRRLQALMHHHQTLERSYAVAHRFTQDAKRAARRIDDGPVRTSLLALCDYVLARRS